MVECRSLTTRNGNLRSHWKAAAFFRFASRAGGDAVTDAEFVEAMVFLTGNTTAPSVLLSPTEFDRLEALAQCGLQLAKDVSDGMDCLPSCNADAHDEICPFAHSEVAWRTLRQQLADVK